MIKEPWFWKDNSRTAQTVSTLLSPIGFVYHLVTAYLQKKNYQRPLDNTFIICIGNAMLGGVGKTPFAIALRELLQQENTQIPKDNFSFLSRGYGGAISEPTLLNPSHHIMADVGDEALLLAQHGPTWISKNRKAGAIHAQRSGATLMIADDGFQNSSLPKDFSFLLLPTQNTSNNQFVFPAGPFREPVKTAIARANMVIFVGDTKQEKASDQMITLLGDKPYCHAWLEAYDNEQNSERNAHAKTQPSPPYGPEQEQSIQRQSIIAFCGIARPYRFFAMLERLGYNLVSQVAFPDHHIYTDVQLATLHQQAANNNARLITTEKDFVRLPHIMQKDITTLRVKMTLDNPELIMNLCEQHYKEKMADLT